MILSLLPEDRHVGPPVQEALGLVPEIDLTDAALAHAAQVVRPAPR